MPDSGKKQSRKLTADLEKEQELQAQFNRADEERRIAKEQLDRERLIRVTDEVIRTITTPEFFERMRLAREAADEGAGLDAAADLLSIERLREAGVDIPEDFRISSRTFEDRIQGLRFELQPVQSVGGTDPIRPDIGVCAGGGGLTFCACGGFSLKLV